MRKFTRCFATTTPNTTATRRAVCHAMGRRCCTVSSTAVNAATNCACSTKAVRNISVITCGNNTANPFVSGCRPRPLTSKPCSGSWRPWRRPRSTCQRERLPKPTRSRTTNFAARRQQLQRLRYAASRAERQYQQVDPENRLIAAELERRWEAALRELRDAEARNWPTTSSTRRCGPSPRTCWKRCTISGHDCRNCGSRAVHFAAEKIAAASPDRQSGGPSPGWPSWRPPSRPRGVARRRDHGVSVPVSVGRFADRTGAAQMEATVLRLADQGHSDTDIAASLTAQGYRSPHSTMVLPSTVKTIRLRHHLYHCECQSHPRRIQGYLTIPQLAEKLNVSRHWISDRIHNGTIVVAKDTISKCYLFPDNLETLRQFKRLQGRQNYPTGL